MWTSPAGAQRNELLRTNEPGIETIMTEEQLARARANVEESLPKQVPHRSGLQDGLRRYDPSDSFRRQMWQGRVFFGRL